MNNKSTDHFEVTEQRILDDEASRHGRELNSQPKLQLNCLGNPLSVKRAIVGTIILLAAIILAVIVRGDNPDAASNNFLCAGIGAIGLFVSFVVWLKK